MRVLVTGAAGFLGARLAAALAADPRVSAVTGLDRVPAGGTPGFITAEMADFERAAPAADLVLHAAAITSQASEVDPEAAHAVNIDGARALLRWARAQPSPPRILYLSSVAVLGHGEPVATEDSRPAPRSTYGTTKIVAEALLQDATRRGEANAVILRLPVTIIRTATRIAPPGAGFVSDLIDSALRGRPFTAPLPPDHAIPVASVKAVTALALRAALGPVPARLLHVPSLAASVDLARAALLRCGFPVEGIGCAPDPGIVRLVAGWPARLGTLYPAFSEDIADPSLESIIRAYAAQISPRRAVMKMPPAPFGTGG
ncbi:NAD-dependent epimerase/dehydratase family protein [Roseomonas sp. KE2513]|uniref:NAD-dependent epimerase/dehydratase family protein n=1 Tax=Roseomonas sp. KE2513 TaxID=2479202 RepID=UPI0018DF691A|nr:NAD-dependent epimerase/dehydratase family protein [Roseomonas sp. KE2513]MBI0536844.1 NAD-dependent epimerase/dehydratase family protein [Roseomonas sp. KE2513]